MSLPAHNARMYGLGELVERDSFGLDAREPAALDPPELTRREAEVAVVAEQRVEILERRVGLDEGARAVLDEAPQLEADDALRAVGLEVLIERVLEYGSHVSGAFAFGAEELFVEGDRGLRVPGIEARIGDDRARAVAGEPAIVDDGDTAESGEHDRLRRRSRLDGEGAQSLGIQQPDRLGRVDLRGRDADRTVGAGEVRTGGPGRNQEGHRFGQRVAPRREHEIRGSEGAPAGPDAEDGERAEEIEGVGRREGIRQTEPGRAPAADQSRRRTLEIDRVGRDRGPAVAMGLALAVEVDARLALDQADRARRDGKVEGRDVAERGDSIRGGNGERTTDGELLTARGKEQAVLAVEDEIAEGLADARRGRDALAADREVVVAEHHVERCEVVHGPEARFEPLDEGPRRERARQEEDVAAGEDRLIGGDGRLADAVAVEVGASAEYDCRCTGIEGVSRCVVIEQDPEAIESIRR